MIEALALIGASYVWLAYMIGVRFYGPELATTRPLIEHMRTVGLLAISPLGVFVMLAVVAVRGAAAFTVRDDG